MHSGLNRALRLCGIVLLVLQGLFKVWWLFPRQNWTQRQQAIQAWSGQLLRLLRVEVEVHGPASSLSQPGLLVSNHMSWLDIFIINSISPHVFVAKSEITTWPLIGSLCHHAGTIFIERGRRHAVRLVNHQLQHGLRTGMAMAFFPEGTTSLGRSLLPFNSALFDAAIQTQQPIKPVVLCYQDRHGQPCDAAAYIDDMSFADSMARILRQGAMRVRLEVLPWVQAPADATAWDRRSAAEQCRHLMQTRLDEQYRHEQALDTPKRSAGSSSATPLTGH